MQILPSLFIYYINKSTKERCMIRFLVTFFFRPLSICICGSEAKCKPAVTVSFQLFRTQENDSEIDSDFEDFDSDEESDPELVG